MGVRSVFMVVSRQKKDWLKLWTVVLAQVQADDSERSVRRPDGGGEASAGSAADQLAVVQQQPLPGPGPVQLR